MEKKELRRHAQLHETVPISERKFCCGVKVHEEVPQLRDKQTQILTMEA